MDYIQIFELRVHNATFGFAQFESLTSSLLKGIRSHLRFC